MVCPRQAPNIIVIKKAIPLSIVTCYRHCVVYFDRLKWQDELDLLSHWLSNLNYYYDIERSVERGKRVLKKRMLKKFDLIGAVLSTWPIIPYSIATTVRKTLQPPS